MFNKWLQENNLNGVFFSNNFFPDGSRRGIWEKIPSDDYLKAAEECLGYNWPIIRATDYMAFQTEGNRVKQETPSFFKRYALTNLVIGELLEYKGRFIPDIVDGLFSVCEESFWGVSAHKPPNGDNLMLPDVKDHYIDLFVAETASILAYSIYLLKDKLNEFCPEIITRVEYEIEERIVKPYLKHKDYWWMGYYKDSVNNWNPWILSNLLIVFLLRRERDESFYEAVRKILVEINFYYNSIPADGGCDEGATYWSVAGGALCMLLNNLYLSSDGFINLFNDEKIKNIGKYVGKAYIGDGYFVNFADGGCRPHPSLAIPVYIYALRIMDKNLSDLSREIFSVTNEPKVAIKKEIAYLERRLYELIFFNELTKDSNLNFNETEILENLENSFVREEKWFYAAKGGNNDEYHNHNDVGSFMVYYDNKPLLVDPGCGVYTKQTFSDKRYEIWTMQSEWHNLPVICGKSQKEGKFKADKFSLDGKTTEISFAEPYNSSEIISVNRKVSFFDNSFILNDSFILRPEQNKVIENFITPFKIKLADNKAIINDEFLLETSQNAKLTMDYVSFEGDEKLVDTWKVEGLNRVSFTFETVNTFEVSFKLTKI